MNQLYIKTTFLATAILVFTDIVNAQQTIDVCSFSKENLILHQIDASSVARGNVKDLSTLEGIDNDNNVKFLISGNNYDAIHFNRAITVNGQLMPAWVDGPGTLATYIHLKNGQTMDIRGVDSPIDKLSPDYFKEINGEIVFSGSSNNYTFCYNPVDALFYLDNRAWVYPDVMWVCGQGYGHPKGDSATSKWLWYDHRTTAMAKKVSEGVYECTLFLSSDFAFKFFKQYGWGEEIGSITATPYPENQLSYGYTNDEVTGNIIINGDYQPGKDFKPGAYTLRLDLNKNCCLLKEHVDESKIDNIVRINGKPLTQISYTGEYYRKGETIIETNNYLGTEIDFEAGQEVTINGIPRPDKTLHPDFFQYRDEKIYFTGRTGRYRISYHLANNLTYVEPITIGDNRIADQPYAVWITGEGLGHPRSTMHRYCRSAFNWSDQIHHFVLTGNGNGKYKGSIFFEPNDEVISDGPYFQFYSWKGSWDCIYPAHSVKIVNNEGASFGVFKGSQNYGAGAGFTPGVYTVELDTKTSPATVSFSKKEELNMCIDGGYLFAFMTNQYYGKLFYALSRDGYNWTILNNKQFIDPAYIGHPDICKGRDGAYYMLAVQPFALWRSVDLIHWEKTILDEQILNKSSQIGYYTTYYLGAPKMFYDKDSDQYMITWHACTNPIADDWPSMRTLYVLTSDFVNFTFPQRLFDFSGEDANMCTIDNIIKKVDDTYYAFYKDERESEIAPLTGKTVRVSTSKSLTGPYSNPSTPLTPNDNNREAPMVVEQPNGAGWFLYAECCLGFPLGYSIFASQNIDGGYKEGILRAPDITDGTERPLARHGAIVKIPENIYIGLLNAKF